MASNSVSASAFFVVSLVADCFTAKAVPRGQSDTSPASLRATSIILVCGFAAPVLVRPARGVYGWFQRPIFFVLLAAAAMLGQNVGGESARTADAAFVTLVTLTCIFLFSAGGVDEQAKSVAAGKATQDAVSSSSALLSIGLLLYSNLRILRGGLWHSSEVRGFHVNPSGLHNASAAIETFGYAHSSAVTSFVMSGGAALGIGAAIVAAVHAKELAKGTGSVSFQFAVAGIFQTVAAFVATLELQDQTFWLPAVFGDTACQEGSVCSAAEDSRRFAAVNTNVAGLWLSSLGLLALAFPPAARVNRAAPTRYFWQQSGVFFALAGFLIAAFSFLSSSAFDRLDDYILFASVFAVFWTAFLDSWTGILVYLVGFFLQDSTNSGTAMEQLVYVSSLAMGFLLIFYLLLTTMSYRRVRQLKKVSASQQLTGIVCVVGTSLALVIFLGGLVATMTASGRYNELQFSSTFLLRFLVPVFVWAPLYTCRCEVQKLSLLQKYISWISIVPLGVIEVAAVLMLVEASLPSLSQEETFAVSIAGASAVVAWLLAARV
jgi:hypothetical protein